MQRTWSDLFGGDAVDEAMKRALVDLFGYDELDEPMKRAMEEPFFLMEVGQWYGSWRCKYCGGHGRDGMRCSGVVAPGVDAGVCVYEPDPAGSQEEFDKFMPFVLEYLRRR